MLSGTVGHGPAAGGGGGFPGSMAGSRSIPFVSQYGGDCPDVVGTGAAASSYNFGAGIHELAVSLRH